MTKSIVLNGVDREKLSGAIEALTADASLARFQFRLSNQWVNGGENRSRIDSFYGLGQEIPHKQSFALVNDEPEVLLSNDKAPNPVEYLLHALAGCLVTTLVYHAAARDIAIKGVVTRFEGDLDVRGLLGITDTVRRGFQTIRVMFDIDADCDDAGKQELIAMAQAYSPVFDMLSNGVPVNAMLASKMQAKAA
ncbi:MAG: OsmC family protein [Pseudolabrys sp.]|nr:OsmC family protein [Pseudolabrys sp.]